MLAVNIIKWKERGMHVVVENVNYGYVRPLCYTELSANSFYTSRLGNGMIMAQRNLALTPSSELRPPEPVPNRLLHGNKLKQ